MESEQDSCDLCSHVAFPSLNCELRYLQVEEITFFGSKIVIYFSICFISL